MIKIAACFVFILVSQYGTASQTNQCNNILDGRIYQNQRGEAIPYRLFVPEKYDRKKKYPLVLFLHGGGGRGTDNLRQIQGGNGFILDYFIRPETQAQFPSFVVAPQSFGEGWVESGRLTPSSQLQLVLELIESLQKEYDIDRQRLYVAGQSLGAYGTFSAISAHPDLFAAAIPISGGGEESKAERIADVSIWVFHGDKDDVVSVERSRRMVAAIRRAGGKPKYTEYAGEGHVIWQNVFNEPELLSWLFSQKRTL